ncbi:expressed unknown protein [Seminavis robusta]|nr:expressed unknown protein [Seminavis robusta]|eukprot:Sro881_g215190.1 n/a (232) ;mRNA; r:3984-4679
MPLDVRCIALSKHPQAISSLFLVPKMPEYGADVLNKRVFIEFLVDRKGTRRPFAGTICRVLESTDCGDDGILIRYVDHEIKFDDGDVRVFNLQVEEDANRLFWKAPVEDACGKKRRARGGAESCGPEQKKSCHEHDKGRPTIARFHAEKWLRNLPQWLEDDGLSKDTIRGFLTTAMKLASGEGITYKNWPEGVTFYRGIPVSPLFGDSQWEKLFQDIKEYEKKYCNGIDIS